MSVTEKLAQFIVDTHYEDFDANTVRAAKDFILNSLGAMIVGAREPVCQILIRHVKDMGGTPEVGVIGAGFKTSLPSAVLVNGAASHAVEQEPVGKLAGGSPLGGIPASLAIAEKFKLSGRCVIEAVVVGQEISGRLGLGCPGGSNRGWSGVYSTMSAVAASSKMLKLDVMQTRMAFGIAADAIGGTWRHCGYMEHFADSGTCSHNGVTSALLAKDGMTADPDIIDGEGGFGEWVGEYKPELALKDIGKPFYTAYPGASIKKYNCCFGMHRALDALWQMLWENDIYNDQIESVQVIVPKFVTKLIHYPDPQNAEQAKFSFEHAFAVIMVDRLPDQKTQVWSFSNAGANAPKYKEARKKVSVVLTEKAGGRSLVGKEMPVTIKLKDGRTFTKETPVLKGSTELPLSKEELVARFEDHVKGFLTPKQIKSTVDWVYNLEQLPDILELMQVATFGSGMC